MKYYCTLFNRDYMAKGIAMLDSLERHHKSDSYTVFVLAMDAETYKVMIRRSIGSNVKVLPLELSGKKIFDGLEKKFGRQAAFWGMASHWLGASLSLKAVDHMTYLDSDLFFFSDPQPIFDEIGGLEVGIIPHRFPSWDAERLKGSGQFNVGWVTARKSALGHIEGWMEQVWNRCDASTCGDQKYLDEWPERLGDKLCVISNIGADMAPWNAGRFAVGPGRLDGVPLVVDTEGDMKSMKELIFYHMHEFKSPENRTGYKLTEEQIHFIYKPYEKAIALAQEEINASGL